MADGLTRFAVGMLEDHVRRQEPIASCAACSRVPPERVDASGVVSDADLLAAQQVTALAILAITEDGPGAPVSTDRLVVCAACGRRMEGH
jgi:hypothetical protein